jgi:hypothetical protein
MTKCKNIVTHKKEHVPIAMICDVCGKEFKYAHPNKNIIHDEFAILNMIHISKSFGYESIIGDEKDLDLDICEQCFIDKLGLDLIQKHLRER